MEFEKIVKEILDGELDLSNFIHLMNKTRDFENLRRLFYVASKLRDENIGRELKLDGFIYPVKPCNLEKYCLYCSNYVERFRLKPLNAEEVQKAVDFIKDSGTKNLTLEGGTSKDSSSNNKILDFINIARKAGLNVILDFYPISPVELKLFRDAGVSEIYASFELIDNFERFKPGESLKEREELAKEICRQKINLASTVLIGLPGTGPEEWIKTLLYLKRYPIKHCFISGFRPVLGTPLENCAPALPTIIAKIVAIARLIFKDADISAGGSVGDPNSLPLLLESGANRAYLGAYVTRVRTSKGFSDELESVFKTEYEVKIQGELVFANPVPYVYSICEDLGFEVL
ncbi:MAG: biotin synthase [Archaeoglobaceae archaeon]|nr:biotin synthase [Archaeoglobaceae archaeon]MDK2877222.1 biotin synthase [Archaeoglobaceae archaeon]